MDSELSNALTSAKINRRTYVLHKHPLSVSDANEAAIDGWRIAAPQIASEGHICSGGQASFVGTLLMRDPDPPPSSVQSFKRGF